MAKVDWRCDGMSDYVVEEVVGMDRGVKVKESDGMYGGSGVVVMSLGRCPGCCEHFGFPFRCYLVQGQALTQHAPSAPNHFPQRRTYRVMWAHFSLRLFIRMLGKE